MRFRNMFYREPVGFISVLVLVLFSVVCAFFNHRIAMYAFACSMIVLAACLFYALYGARVVKKSVEQLNHSLGQDGTGTADEFPLPGAIFDYYGNIVWFNELFGEEILGEKETRIPTADDLFEAFNFKSFQKIQTISTEYKNRLYTAFISHVKSEKEPYLSVHFLDDTYYKRTEHEYKITRPFVMLIMIDNIESLYRQYSDSQFALLTSGMESRIEKWVKNEKLIFRKTANGRFLIIGEMQSLSHFTEDKFSILRLIREYKFNGRQIDATLSIGVGTGADYIQCEAQAKRSLDMALGRGGDQAAVFNDGSYIYFGGMHDGSTDDSKVNPRQTSANIAGLFRKYERVLIVGHRFSDFDSMGAALGMLFLAQINGTEARIVVSEKKTLALPLVNLVKESGYDLFLEPDEAVKLCDSRTVMVAVDTHRAQLLECPELNDKAAAKVVVDHHRRCEDYISDADIFYHLPSPSSASEMVAELIEYSTQQDEILPAIIATGLLAGIVLDTKDFVLRTSRRTFEAAAFLRQCGADTVAVRKFFSVDESLITLKNEIIANGKIYRDGMMIAVTDSSDRELRVVSSRAADEMLNVEGVRASFVIATLGDAVNISARSLGEENVQLIMELLGGGGHNTMAAAQVPDCTPDEAKELLLKAIDKYSESRK